jgi:hypothetical protein
MKRSEEDHCLYFCNTKEMGIVILCLYVDDGLLCCSSKKTMMELIDKLSKEFKITHGVPNCYVGMEISRNRKEKTITVCQKGYTSRMLSRFGMKDAKPVNCPADPSLKLSKDMDEEWTQGEQMERVPYREAVGALNYLAVISRPDIAFAVSRVARFSENPSPSHWSAVKRIMRYLKGTISYALVFGKEPGGMTMTGYCDSDWAGDIESRCSTSGFIFTLNGGPVSWSSKLQKTCALSSTEAEYMAMTEALKEVLWFRPLLTELGILEDGPTRVLVDNQGALSLSRNAEFHRRTKHISVRFHRIREEQEEGQIKFDYVETMEQAADFLTKPLGGQQLKKCLKMVNIEEGHKQEEVLGTCASAFLEATKHERAPLPMWG